jgi:hypothetical protein
MKRTLVRHRILINDCGNDGFLGATSMLLQRTKVTQLPSRRASIQGLSQAHPGKLTTEAGQPPDMSSTESFQARQDS